MFFTLWLGTPVSLPSFSSRENSSPHPCSAGVKHSTLRWMGFSTTLDVYAKHQVQKQGLKYVYDFPHLCKDFESHVFKSTSAKFSHNFLFIAGDKMLRYSYPELAYGMGLKYEKQSEMLPAHMDQAISNTSIPYVLSETLRPMLHQPGPPLSIAEMSSMVNPLFHHVLPLGQRAECPGSGGTLPPQPHDVHCQPTTNGPAALTRLIKLPPKGQEESPNNSGLDSDSARSSPQERQAYHGTNLPLGLRSRASPAVACADERVLESSPRSGTGAGNGSIRAATERSTSQEGVRVFGREGQELRAFQCEHCQVLFLDHVMYTIHMGCHGYRDPLECNICGHHSKDCYEFSSHIVRGEHTFQ